MEVNSSKEGASQKKCDILVLINQSIAVRPLHITYMQIGSRLMKWKLEAGYVQLMMPNEKTNFSIIKRLSEWKSQVTVCPVGLVQNTSAAKSWSGDTAKILEGWVELLIGKSHCFGLDQCCESHGYPSSTIFCENNIELFLQLIIKLHL